jgi:hypothetical protein
MLWSFPTGALGAAATDLLHGGSQLCARPHSIGRAGRTAAAWSEYIPRPKRHGDPILRLGSFEPSQQLQADGRLPPTTPPYPAKCSASVWWATLRMSEAALITLGPSALATAICHRATGRLRTGSIPVASPIQRRLALAIPGAVSLPDPLCSTWI